MKALAEANVLPADGQRARQRSASLLHLDRQSKALSISRNFWSNVELPLFVVELREREELGEATEAEFSGTSGRIFVFKGDLLAGTDGCRPSGGMTMTVGRFGF